MIAWLNKYILGAAVPILLVAVGAYFGFRLGWFHILHPIKTLRLALGGNRKKAFSALTLALAGTLGVGNIVGVAAALAGGGCGAVFWMWISAFFAMILKYSEIVLSIRHKRYDRDGSPHGSAMYYINDSFSSRGYKKTGVFLSASFAAFFVLNALTMGSLLQVGAVTDALRVSISAPEPLTAAILAAVTVMIVTKGRDGAIRFSERIVPIMTLCVLLLSAAVLIMRAERLPDAFARIFTEAFDIRAMGSGILGFLLSDTLRLGVMRGLISNEAGCGTSPTAHAEAEGGAAAAQGVWGIFEVFVDTVVLCTVTALVLIVSGVPLEGGALMEMTLSAYSSVLGEWSVYLMSAAVVCFGFATVVCWSHYGKEGAYYLSGRPAAKKCFLLAFVLSVLFGGTVTSGAAWQLADLAVGAMTLINLFALVLSAKEIAEETKNSLDKRRLL